jgi:hypothetical protein
MERAELNAPGFSSSWTSSGLHKVFDKLHEASNKFTSLLSLCPDAKA